MAETKTPKDVVVIPSVPKNGQSPESDTKIIDLREISVTGVQYYKAFGVADYNPDDLAARKGLEIYSKMRLDDQVKAVLHMKKFARLQTPWSIIPASKNKKDQEIADFVKDQLDGLEGTFEMCLMNILTALDYGFSITEKVFQLISKGTWTNKIGLRALKTREPFYYYFDSDQFGNLRPDGIIYIGPQYQYAMPDYPTSSDLTQDKLSVYGGGRLPVNKFIIYSYNKEFSNHYGKSDLRAAYRSWWSKEILIRFHNIYMERFGMPTTLAKYPKSTSKPDREKLRQVLENVQAKYAIVIPDDMEIELLNAVSNENGFQSAIEMHNRFMARSMLVPDLMGYTTGGAGGSGGSYALGRKHFDVFLWILKQLGRDIEEGIVGEQIIKQLVDINYDNVDKYPQFQFESVTEDATETKAKIVQMGVAGGFINPLEEWVRPYLQLPRHDERYALGIPFPLPGQAPTAGAEPAADGEEEELPPEDDVKKQAEETVGVVTPDVPRARVESNPSSTGGTARTDVVPRSGVVRCPYPRCGDSNIRMQVPDAFLTRTYQCQSCLNVFKITREGDLYLYDKVRKTWLREPVSIEPSYFAARSVNALVLTCVRKLREIVAKQRDDVVSTISTKFVESPSNDVSKIQLKFVGDLRRELEYYLVRIYTTYKVDSDATSDEVDKCSEVAFKAAGECRDEILERVRNVVATRLTAPESVMLEASASAGSIFEEYLTKENSKLELLVRNCLERLSIKYR